ncbi:MAG: type II secretion system protein [Legionella sp.]|uniref:type II secretion system protein n=1 Tax=Legionella sp. TaxID=459 RepID=UPI00284EC656|nr:type II secretion system protein [Legionella sp.]
MKRRQQGFIFLIVLLITAVISLLVVSSMHHLLFYFKVTNHQEALHQRFYQLEAVARQLAQKPPSSGCIRHQDLANHALNTLLQHQGCSFNDGELSYQYVLEDLGTFPCLVVYEQGQKRTSHHQRISVVLMEEGVAVSFLQIRSISSSTIAHCAGDERLVRLGMSSWRYLGSI